VLALVALPSRAAEEAKDSAALAKALGEAKVSLAQGLQASAPEGKPISGKYELDNGALQLSVYTMKGDQFSEVIVDHKSGSIKKTEKITDADDLKDAKEQNLAMAKAKVALDQAVSSAVKANAGYSAVSVMPELKADHPVAEITLMKGAEVKKITEKLD
jgi:hypothetical protein